MTDLSTPHQDHLNEASLIVTSLNLTNKYLLHVEQKKNSKDFYIGLLLALMSSFFIGSSFILKKKGLIKLSVSSPSQGSVLRAGMVHH